ncbi:hypothetical protein [Pseudomonas sp. SK2]|uniref:hypothetical protein n=1 Tax=Pseudomonas sp. SK2 TaxID=2841063 RepID=UPI00192AE628|nr:hypothetical protein [Pseudomonas sp. SK2]QQZ38428.1 hypothetical protein IF103_11150 [Pseudomonas sp. SK2]
MFKELVFSTDAPLESDAYVGGGARLPKSMSWPRSDSGLPLVHLLAFPVSWLSDAASPYWISIFIPYEPGKVSHYGQLRMKSGESQAAVLIYERCKEIRNESEGKIVGCGRIIVLENNGEDDEENLASKIDGVDSWLQAPLEIVDAKRRVSIYGGDLDLSIPENKGVLSDGMGYLLLSDDFVAGNLAAAHGFFLQLG